MVKLHFIIVCLLVLIVTSVEGKENIKRCNIDELLKHWMSTRIEKDLVEDEVFRTLIEMGKTPIGSQYIDAFKISVKCGDLKSAKEILDSAFLHAPISRPFEKYYEAPPYFLRAQFYYYLALFDAVARELYKIRRTSKGDVSLSDLRESYLYIEIQELVSDGRPMCYRRLLKKTGFDDKEISILSMYFVLLDSYENFLDYCYVVGENSQKYNIPNSLEDKKLLPDVLPIPTWTPDQHNKEILLLALAEIRIAEQKGRISSLECPSIEKRVKIISKRIDALLK